MYSGCLVKRHRRAVQEFGGGPTVVLFTRVVSCKSFSSGWSLVIVSRQGGSDSREGGLLTSLS